MLADPVDRVGLFRRSFEPSTRLPAAAPARLWIDGRYVLRVNGVELGARPGARDPGWPATTWSTWLPTCSVGENVLAVTGRHFGRATSWWMPVPPTYSLGAGSLRAGGPGRRGVGRHRPEAGDCRPGEAWTPVPVPGDVACLPLESFDARRHPHGWERPRLRRL